MSKLQPMLGCKDVITTADYEKLTYPLIASPKLDGIRVTHFPGLGPVTRKLKDIPNDYVRGLISLPELAHFDGELIVGSFRGEGVFNRTQSGIMTKEGQPDFRWHVFDYLEDPSKPFEKRYLDLYSNRGRRGGALPHCVRRVSQAWITTPHELDDYVAHRLRGGFEGVMIRRPDGHYKFGRSTRREGLLLKIKPYVDFEAMILDWEPLEVNHNKAMIDERGYKKRSSHKANKRVDATRMGRLRVMGLNGRWANTEFYVGTGFTTQMREDMAANFSKYRSMTATLRYQDYGSKDKPRVVSFKGLRRD